ncbi:ImmA/IrrE family metallo-endopeptidase [Cutibacterium avidum]|uniref:ImmA/IrrE family metallo-endopeptidase n=1 Tax=Cutibacterium avidum TaxID=33010 RepID=UPI0002CCDB5F|nr:ImmA/IrrE family metallo-endopeptidase [Cutibacterium avidum]AGJ76686.1 Zn peptidase [Cutibacterium avidum 44067]MCO6671427.1 ImmA/IrrE family metallo-endopeptidase [Cutibacterium avidum]MDU5023071.1 ImmA/IrrE family metallo-endopeptidase [Cutibacterium avidum]PGX67454.1 Zn peptidase [Cutibacterium avidum]PGX69019.1 Zn peptidase [Cutibacterium avidum]
MTGLTTDDPDRAARQILETTIATGGAVRVPVDVTRVACRLGLAVERRLLEPGVDGLLVKLEGQTRFRAVVSSRCDLDRRRFVLAHEIGHHVREHQGPWTGEAVLGRVERHRELSMMPVTTTDPDERWADDFATALLMPAGVVATLWSTGMDLDVLARRLGVTPAALTLRLTRR